MSTKVKHLKREIEQLTDRERAELLDNLQDSVEDYLLSKIAYQRHQEDSGRRYSWESIKKHSGI